MATLENNTVGSTFSLLLQRETSAGQLQTGGGVALPITWAATGATAATAIGGAVAIAGLYTATGGVTLPAGADIAFTGTTGTNDITLTNSLADALSVTRAGTDMIVFDSNTPKIDITPNVTMAGTLDVASTIQAGSSNITLTTAAGLLKHEAGGLEVNVSAITTGGIFMGNSSGVVAILAAGSNDQVLTLATGKPSWADAGGGGRPPIFAQVFGRRD